jgi:hypothetical protein
MSENSRLRLTVAAGRQERTSRGLPERAAPRKRPPERMRGRRIRERASRTQPIGASAFPTLLRLVQSIAATRVRTAGVLIELSLVSRSVASYPRSRDSFGARGTSFFVSSLTPRLALARLRLGNFFGHGPRSPAMSFGPVPSPGWDRER